MSSAAQTTQGELPIVVWALAALSAVAAAVIGRFLPAAGQRATVSVRAEFKALRSTRLWPAPTAAVLIMGGSCSPTPTSPRC